jgi:tetratricopeptide (TPR) repeat protein
MNAIADCKQALRINPSNADAYNNKGLCLLNLKLYQDAVLDFKKTIEINYAHTYAYLNLGWCQICLGNEAEALRNISSAMELDADLSKSYWQNILSQYQN